MTSQELAAAMAGMVKDYVKADRAALETRLAVLEAKLATPVSAPPPVAELAPADLAASLAGVLRAELLADLPVVKSTRKVVRDAQGAVKFEIEETS